MDKYTKLFIKSSFIYLALGMLLGLHMAFGDMAAQELRFIHVHLMLVGFVAMLIFGVSYHILPRFNAKPVPFPSWIPLHFWLMNAGLTGMVLLYGVGAFWTTGPLRALFGLFSAVIGVAIILFVINMYSVLRDEPEEKETPAPTPAPVPEAQEPVVEIKLSPQMKIAEIVEKWPHLQEALIQEGLGNVANPAAVNTVGKMISLEMAAKKAGIELFPLIASLEGKKLLNTDEVEQAQAEAEAAVAGNPKFKHGEMAKLTTLIGDLLEVYPETKPVFETHYGAACFTCPGHKTETVEQTAAMHNLPSEMILGEINEKIEAALNS